MRPLILTVAAVALLGCVAAAVRAQPSFTQNPVPVTVTNPSIPVTVTASAPLSVNVGKDPISPVMYRFSLDNSSHQTVVPSPPAGKVFVLTHLSVFLGANIAGQPLAPGLCVLTISTLFNGGTLTDALAIYRLDSAAGDTLAVNANTYFVLKPTETLGMTCTTSTTQNVFKTAAFGGYTVPSP